jgi:predicted nucleotide-binding protein
LGYPMGKIGRERVVVLLMEGTEIPSDLAGLRYVVLDPTAFRL